MAFVKNIHSMKWKNKLVKNKDPYTNVINKKKQKQKQNRYKLFKAHWRNFVFGNYLVTLWHVCGKCIYLTTKK